MSAPGSGAAASALLAESGLCTMTPGLTKAEFTAVERRFGFSFNADHREFLTAGLPVGPSWPYWRNGDAIELHSHLGVPARHILGKVRTEGLWRHTWGDRPLGDDAALGVANERVARAPRMVPIFGYAFTPAAPEDAAGVWSIEGGRARRAADDLMAFVRLQTGHAVRASPPSGGGRLAFWDDFAENPELVAPGLPNLTVPPFPADPPLREPAAVLPPRDPAGFFADHGVDLGPLTRHDDVLAHRAPMWTAPVTPGYPALETWVSLRDLFPSTGLWPVLITERVWHRSGADGVPDREPVLGAHLDGAAWLSAEYERRTDEEPLPRGWEPWSPTSMSWKVAWSRISRVERYDRIALVPTPAHWYVPGLLQWTGALNYDVLGTAHASVLRRWSVRWGAELLALDDETADLRVTSPPSLGPEALEAAVEAYLYCPDSIDVHPDGVDALAPFMIRELWSFWWD